MSARARAWAVNPDSDRWGLLYPRRIWPGLLGHAHISRLWVKDSPCRRAGIAWPRTVSPWTGSVSTLRRAYTSRPSGVCSLDRMAESGVLNLLPIPAWWCLSRPVRHGSKEAAISYAGARFWFIWGCRRSGASPLGLRSLRSPLPPEPEHCSPVSKNSS